jgi:hypothetical protein
MGLNLKNVGLLDAAFLNERPDGIKRFRRLHRPNHPKQKRDFSTKHSCD